MARYCFYCGRELTTGEKCQCRTHGTAAGGSSQAGPEPAGPDRPAGNSDSQNPANRQTAGSGQAAKTAKAGDTARSGKTAKTTKTGKAGKAEKASASARAESRWSGRPAANNAQTRVKSGGPGWFKTWQSRFSQAGQTSRSARGTPWGQAKSSASGRRFDLAGLLTSLMQITRYFNRPADTIRQAAQYANRRRTFLLLALQGVLGGAALLAASWQPQFSVILQLTIVSTRQAQPLVSGLFIFLQGLGITLVANLILILIDHLALRYLFRQPVDFIRLLSGQNPALLYFNLFLLSALLSLPVSLISSLLMLVAGFALAAIAHFLALRQITGFDENRTFTLIAFVMLVYSAFLATLFNLALPVLKNLLDQSVVL